MHIRSYAKQEFNILNRHGHGVCKISHGKIRKPEEIPNLKIIKKYKEIKKWSGSMQKRNGKKKYFKIISSRKNNGVYRRHLWGKKIAK